MQNIHFTTDDREPEPTAHTVEEVAAALPEKMRLRRTAVSPLEEYHLRPGQVRPIADSLAAMILSCKGRAEVNLKGIRIKREDLTPDFRSERNGVVFWHPDSIVCSDLSAREKKWFYVLNRQDPDCLHLLDKDGRYIETLPRKERPHALDNKAQARVYAEDQRAIKRASARLQELHGDETWKAIETARRNKEISSRYVQTMDPSFDPEKEAEPEKRTPANSITGDQIRRAENLNRRAIERHDSAVDLGRAVAAQRSSITPDPEDIETEDWSDHRNQNQPATHEDIESW